MSSARMLQLANALHHGAYECDGEENKMPFAETQQAIATSPRSVVYNESVVCKRRVSRRFRCNFPRDPDTVQFA